MKVDLAVTRIGCQWQQIIKDKNVSQSSYPKAFY